MCASVCRFDCNCQAEHEEKRLARDNEWRAAIERIGEELQAKEHELRNLKAVASHAKYEAS